MRQHVLAGAKVKMSPMLNRLGLFYDYCDTGEDTRLQSKLYSTERKD